MDFKKLKEKINETGATLVAVSKTHPSEKIETIYNQGHRDFGENKVQELVDKMKLLPDDIRWHMIGHLQSNKVKYLAPFVHLIHSLDRISLAREINKEGRKSGRVIRTLLQIKIAKEDSKFGINPDFVDEFMEKFQKKDFDHVHIVGVMGLATFTNDDKVVKDEFHKLETVFKHLERKHFKNDSEFRIKSYGMSSDYEIALETGSNMVRVGSLIFGERNY